MSRELLPAFNTRRYSKDDPRVVHDLAATMIEGSGKVMPYTLTYLDSGKVVQILKDTPLGKIKELEDVEKFYDKSTPEGRAGVKIRKILVHEPINSAAIWVSPPGGKYKHTSIQVGYVAESLYGEKDLVSFGFQVVFSTVNAFALAKNIHKLALTSVAHLTPNELRNTVFKIKIPEESEPITYLKQILPLNLWTDVENGEIYKYWEKALKDADVAVSNRKSQIESATTKDEHYVAGAAAEGDMIAQGWSTQYLDCDLPNSAFLNHTNITLSQHGTTLFSRDIVRTINCECGICHKNVTAKIVGGKIYCPHINCPGNKGVSYSC